MRENSKPIASMKELLKHFPAIKKFMEERTQTLQELSDSMVKNFLREAYKLPFLFPVRIIISEEKFVNFLFDMRKELFEGKNIVLSSSSLENKKNDLQESNKSSSIPTTNNTDSQNLSNEISQQETNPDVPGPQEKAKKNTRTNRRSSKKITTNVT
ncbi:MAG: hypothetical protein QXZ13_04010 [Candidatus Diapherotrites archaeon]